MRRASVGLAIAATCIIISGCLHVPMPWSPDGTWIAYTVEVRPLDQIVAPGWTFDVGTAVQRPIICPPVRYRLWATKAATNVSVLLEDSPGPLTAPAWSPDGHALAFGRVVIDADRSSRFEVVVLEGLTRRRIVSSKPLGPLDAEASRLASQGIAWSPDGRYLAVPQLQPLGLLVLRADNGRVVNTIPDAFLPSWAPVGGRLAFYVRSNGHALQCIESPTEHPRKLLDVEVASQAPIWARDGESIAVVARRSNLKAKDAGADLIELLRIQLDTSVVETIRSISADAGPNRDRPIEGISIAFDRDGENLFCSAPVEGRLNQITWYHPRDGSVFKKFSILDPSIITGSLSFSADNRTLAARAVLADRSTAPVLTEPEHSGSDPQTRLVVPDDSARLEWIAALTKAAATILQDLRSEVNRGGGRLASSTARPTILPVLNELRANPEAFSRLRQIGKLGRPVCDRPTTATDLDQPIARLFDEARLFFDYLSEDYPGALRDLESLELAEEDSTRRVALMSVRAQILLNQGQNAAAKRIIAFLDRGETPTNRRLEGVADGYRLTEEAAEGRGWPRYLTECAAKIQAGPSEPQPDGLIDEPMPRRNAAELRRVPQMRANPGIPPGEGGQPFVPRRPVPAPGQPR